MKVLIISNNEEKINLINSFMKSRNYDVIIYKWLLKAIDNIEEIRPDIIFLSATEFPRHWKTLASFVQSGIGGNNIKLYLYEQEALPEDEMNKAKALGIEDCITSLDEEYLKKYFPDLSSSCNEVTAPTQIIITNPVDECLYYGKVLCISDSIIKCKINNYIPETGAFIKEISVCSNGEIKFLSADVKEYNVTDKIITFSVSEYYEEK